MLYQKIILFTRTCVSTEPNDSERFEKEISSSFSEDQDDDGRFKSYMEAVEAAASFEGKRDLRNPKGRLEHCMCAGEGAGTDFENLTEQEYYWRNSVFDQVGRV